MSRYDTDPKYRKAVDEALTGGPSQAATQYRKLQRLEDQPGYNPGKDPNLLRRIKHLTLKYDDNKLGPEFDKAIDQEDRELAKLGRDPKNILQRNNAVPTQKKINEIKGDRKVRKYILNQVKQKAKIPEFKLNINPIVEVEPTLKEDPELEKMKNKIEKMQQDNEREKNRLKYSGLGNFINE